MNKKIKIIIWLVLVIFVVWGMYSLINTQQQGNSEQPIKIAYISALSGEAGSWGQSMKDGFEFGIKEANANKVLNQPIQVIYEDDSCEPTTGITAFNKVLNLDGVKIIAGTICSSVAMSVAPIVQEHKVLYLASGATHPDVPKQGDFIFRALVSDTFEATTLAQYAVNELALHSFAISYINDNPAGPAVRDAFQSTIESLGGEIVITDEFNSNQTDFRTNITKIIKEKPDAIYLGAYPEQVPLFLHKARELGYKGTFLLYGPSVLTEQIQDVGDAYYPMPNFDKQTDFWETFLEESGKQPNEMNALGYDSALLIVEGLKQCGEDPECIRDAWLNLDNFEVSRGTITFDENGDPLGFKFKVEKL